MELYPLQHTYSTLTASPHGSIMEITTSNGTCTVFISSGRTTALTYALTIFGIGIAGCFLAYKIVHIPLQLEVTLLFTAIMFYPILRQPATGVYLLFIIMPFISFLRRLYYLLHQRPGIDPLIATGDLLTIVTLTGLFFAFREERADQPVAPVVKNCITVYFFYLLLRVFFLNSLPLTEAIMRFRLYGPAVLLFFVGAHFSRNRTMLINLWKITIIIGLIGALYGFKQLFIGYSVSEKLWFSSISFTTLFIKGFARPFSLFQSPAAFADYMQLSIVGSLILFNMYRTVKRYLFLPLIALFFYGALITSVRSNWIGILLSLLVWFVVLAIRRNSRRLIAIFGLIAVFLVLQIFSDNTSGGGLENVFEILGGGFNQQYMNLLVTERSSALSNPFEEYSFLSRINLWRYIIELSADPVMALLGRGVGVLNADSLYFTYLAEFGYPGMIFILWLVGYTIRKGLLFSGTFTDHTTVSLVKGITLMNIVFVVVNITGTHIHAFPGDVFFWFWNGVLIAITSTPAAAAQPLKEPDFTGRTASTQQQDRP